MKLSLVFCLASLLATWINPAVANEKMVRADVEMKLTNAQQSHAAFVTSVESGIYEHESRMSAQGLDHEESLRLIFYQEKEAYLQKQLYSKYSYEGVQTLDTTSLHVEEESASQMFESIVADFHSLMVNLGLEGHALIMTVQRDLSAVEELRQSNPKIEASFFDNAINILQTTINNLDLIVDEVIMNQIQSSTSIHVEELCLDIEGAERELTESETREFKTIFAATLEITQAEQGTEAEVLYVTVVQTMADALLRRSLRHEDKSLGRKLTGRSLRMRTGAAYNCRCETDGLDSDVYRALAERISFSTTTTTTSGSTKDGSTTDSGTTSGSTGDSTTGETTDVGEVSSYQMLLAKNLERNVVPLFDTEVVINAISCEGILL